MTSKIRGDVEKLIPPVLIFNRSLNVRSTTFPPLLRLILTDGPRCQAGLQKQAGNSEMLWMGVSLWPPHPYSSNTSMPWIILSPGSFLCTCLGLNPWMQHSGLWITELRHGFVCKNKAMGYISIYYNVASQDKANYLPPPATTERFTVLFSSFCAVVKKKKERKKTCFMLIPRGSAGGDNLTLYLEVLTLFQYILAFFKHLFMIGSFSKTLLASSSCTQLVSRGSNG